MKKIFCIIVVIGLLAWLKPSVCMAQDDYLTDYVSEQLNGYYKELKEWDKVIKTANEADSLEPKFKRHISYVDVIFNEYSELISTDKKLRTLYENYNDLYQSLGKRIENLKSEKDKQELADILTVKLNNYLEQLKGYEEDGKRCVANKNNDSLDIVKKKAQECKVDANKDYDPNRDFIKGDETLSQTWQQIEETCTRIEALKVEIAKGIDMTLILEIVGVIAALTLIISLVSSKIKAAKILRQQLQKDKPKTKPKDPEIPSI